MITFFTINVSINKFAGYFSILCMAIWTNDIHFVPERELCLLMTSLSLIVNFKIFFNCLEKTFIIIVDNYDVVQIVSAKTAAKAITEYHLARSFRKTSVAYCNANCLLKMI